jgi:hypothetical protein
VVALKHDQPDHFVHAHPLNETAPQNGIVDFEIELQEKGMYTIYAQFNINGQIKTFPITLEVKSATTNEIPPSSATPAPQTSTSGISNDIKNDTVLFGESVDTDRDGLDDIREQQIGTSVTATDTDKDGLTDGEEVLVWKTNPLNADTDGDGYLDGDEVKHGYNPLGPGKLPAGQASRGSATSSIGR